VKRQTVDLRLKPSVTEKDDNVGRWLQQGGTMSGRDW
jgi:hypothetical protein